MSAAPAPVASPCIGVCRMDEASGWCSGCLRTLDEIALWSVLDDADKAQVRAELSRRRVQRRNRSTPAAAEPPTGAGFAGGGSGPPADE